MRLYKAGAQWVVGSVGPVWWQGGGISSGSLCDPRRMTKRKAMAALPLARKLLRQSNAATY
jgi:hypothetical protein